MFIYQHGFLNHLIWSDNMIAKLKTIFKKVEEEAEYFWAGHGENPLKEHGIKDLSEKSEKK